MDKIPLDKDSRMLRFGFGKNKGRWFVRLDSWVVGYRMKFGKEEPKMTELITAIPFKPTPDFIRGMIDTYYNKEGNICGGNLHVVLDDGNYNPSSIEFCRKEAEKDNDADGVLLCLVLALFTEEELEEMLTN